MTKVHFPEGVPAGISRERQSRMNRRRATSVESRLERRHGGADGVVRREPRVVRGEPFRKRQDVAAGTRRGMRPSLSRSRDLLPWPGLTTGSTVRYPTGGPALPTASYGVNDHWLPHHEPRTSSPDAATASAVSWPSVNDGSSGRYEEGSGRPGSQCGRDRFCELHQHSAGSWLGDGDVAHLDTALRRQFGRSSFAAPVEPVAPGRPLIELNRVVLRVWDLQRPRERAERFAVRSLPTPTGPRCGRMPPRSRPALASGPCAGPGTSSTASRVTCRPTIFVRNGGARSMSSHRWRCVRCS